MNDAGTLPRHMLEVRELTAEAFAPYGQIVAPLRTGGQGAETAYDPETSPSEAKLVLENGKLSEDQLNESVRRVLRDKPSACATTPMSARTRSRSTPARRRATTCPVGWPPSRRGELEPLRHNANGRQHANGTLR